jgi:hypothetical protein
MNQHPTDNRLKTILYMGCLCIFASLVNAQEEFRLKWSVVFEHSPLSAIPGMVPTFQDLVTTDVIFRQVRTLQQERYQATGSVTVMRSYRYHVLDQNGHTLLSSPWFYGENLVVGKVIHSPSEFVIRVSGSTDPNDDGLYRALSTGTESDPQPFGPMVHHVMPPSAPTSFFALSDSPIALSETTDKYTGPELQTLSLESWGFSQPLPLVGLIRSGETVTISWHSELDRLYCIEVSENLQDWAVSGEQVTGTGEVTQAVIIEPRTKAFFRVRKISQ